MAAILENHFYHNSIRTYTAVFGSLFNDMKIKRNDGKEIKVPIAFAEQQRYNVRLDQDADPDVLRFMKRTPRMSFTLDTWGRDIARTKNPMQQMKKRRIQADQSPSVNSQYNRVPYTFNYTLNVTTKYLEDLFQIFEQIAVYFNPSLQVVVKDNPDLDDDSAITITLLDSQLNDPYEGSYEENRTITATFTFSLEGYLYMPTTDSSIIKTVYVNYYDLDDPTTMIDQTVLTEEDAP